MLLSLRRDLNMSAPNITSKCRIASIAPDDAMILPHDANPRRMKFSERTGLSDLEAELEQLAMDARRTCVY
jgi:hypothetical protein